MKMLKKNMTNGDNTLKKAFWRFLRIFLRQKQAFLGHWILTTLPCDLLSWCYILIYDIFNAIFAIMCEKGEIMITPSDVKPLEADFFTTKTNLRGR